LIATHIIYMNEVDVISDCATYCMSRSRYASDGGFKAVNDGDNFEKRINIVHVHVVMEVRITQQPSSSDANIGCECVNVVGDKAGDDGCSASVALQRRGKGRRLGHVNYGVIRVIIGWAFRSRSRSDVV